MQENIKKLLLGVVWYAVSMFVPILVIPLIINQHNRADYLFPATVILALLGIVIVFLSNRSEGTGKAVGLFIVGFIIGRGGLLILETILVK